MSTVHAVVAVLVAVSGGATPDEKRDPGDRTGVYLSAGTHVGFPYGELADQGGGLALWIATALPLEPTLTWRPSRQWSVGLRYSYGLTLSNCTTCSMVAHRVSAVGELHTLSTKYSDPYLSAALGWEAQTLEVPGDPAPLLSLYMGPELQLRVGIDYPLGKAHWGWFVGGAVGSFRTLHVTILQEGYETIRYPSLHGWFFVGLRIATAPL